MYARTSDEGGRYGRWNCRIRQVTGSRLRGISSSEWGGLRHWDIEAGTLVLRSQHDGKVQLSLDYQ